MAPLLFITMMYDIPKLENVQVSEFADDLIIAFLGTKSSEVTTKIQQQINAIVNWCNICGLKLNLNKTKAMMFTRKRVTNPALTLSGARIEFVKNPKFLGVSLDSPRCAWRAHIDELKKSCVSRLNLVSNISGKDWRGRQRVINQTIQSPDTEQTRLWLPFL